MFEKVFGFFITFVSKNNQPVNEVFYIGGNDILPPPLQAQEEAELLENLEAGDSSVKHVLIERNLRLVVYIARKFENTGVDIEDLTSIGTIGLIKAINTYNPGRNIKLATYASRCIENEILMYLRKNSRARSEVSFEEPLNVDWDGNELLLSDILGTDSDIIQRNLEEETDKAFGERHEQAKRARKEDNGAQVQSQQPSEKTQKRWPTCWVFLNPISPDWKREFLEG